MSGDGMTIFCKRGFVVFTNTGEQKQDDKKSRKHSKNRSVIYPYFEDMKEFNESSYWNDQLTKFSRGIFPRNFKYYNDVLRYNKKKTKNGTQEYSVDETDLKKSFDDLKLFLEDKGILSTLERGEKSLIDFKDEDENMEEWEWKDFKHNQLHLREEFISRKGDEYDLDEKGRVKLESVIRFGISSGIFDNSSIIVEDAKIVKIDGLEWDDYEGRFCINTSFLPKFQSTSKKSNNSKSSRYSSHTFSGDTFCLRNKESSVKVGERWKHFLTDYYK